MGEETLFTNLHDTSSLWGQGNLFVLLLFTIMFLVNVASKPEEGLIYIYTLHCAGLEVLPPVFLCQSRSFRRGHLPFIPKIQFVPHQHRRNRFRFQDLLKSWEYLLFDNLQTVGGSDVEYQYEAMHPSYQPLQISYMLVFRDPTIIDNVKQARLIVNAYLLSEGILNCWTCFEGDCAEKGGSRAK